MPVLVAPMGGGPSTPALVAAVAEAGGSGFLPAGYLTPDAVREQVGRTRALTHRPFGVNVFVPGTARIDRGALDRYVARLRPVAERLGVEPGEPRWDDDRYTEKIDLLVDDPVAAVSFTFGCPSAADVERLHAVGTLVIVTVTSPGQAALAEQVGADALCVQGAEAGAHQGGFDDDPDHPAGFHAQPLEPLLRAVRAASSLPLIAAGGLMTGLDIAGVLAAGADAAQLGTAFLCCPEAGTSATHRQALLDHRYTETTFTRAFTGRTARALVNPFVREFTDDAPAGYPWVHHLTRPIRVAAARRGDADTLNLWAGQGWHLVRDLPAAELVGELAAELAS
ncbi:MAG TPA: nitronate monooxygenase [Micromonosporaceae bacterium]